MFEEETEVVNEEELVERPKSRTSFSLRGLWHSADTCICRRTIGRKKGLAGNDQPFFVSGLNCKQCLF